MPRRKTALVVSVLATVTACGTRPAIDRQMPRPIVRMSLNDGSVSAFLNLPQFSVENVNIGDSEKRLVALQAGSIDLADAVADVTYLAFNGRLPGRSGPIEKIRGIALLSRTTVHLLVGPTTDANHGFRGMRVVLGDPTGGNTALGERLINSIGVATSEIKGEFLPNALAVERLLKGEVDALVLTGRAPQEPVARALRGGARLLDINGPELSNLRVHYPLLRRTLIPRGTYPGQDGALHTVGVDVLLVCRAELDSELVYQVTRAYFEHLPEIIRRRTDPLRAPATVIPLHAGAARYYREREISR